MGKSAQGIAVFVIYYPLIMPNVSPFGEHAHDWISQKYWYMVSIYTPVFLSYCHLLAIYIPDYCPKQNPDIPICSNSSHLFSFVPAHMMKLLLLSN